MRQEALGTPWIHELRVAGALTVCTRPHAHQLMWLILFDFHDSVMWALFSLF